MAKVAIDVVLFLSLEINDLVLNINKTAFEKGKGRFVMSENDFIPHITLTMGVIDEKDLSFVKEKLDSLALSFSKVPIILEKLRHYEKDNVRKAHIQIKVDEKLYSLHKQVLEIMLPYLKEEATAETLFDGEKTGISSSTKRILENFAKDYALEKFHAHITLCCFDADTFVDSNLFPINSSASSLALVRVGDGGVARRVLWRKDLD